MSKTTIDLHTETGCDSVLALPANLLPLLLIVGICLSLDLQLPRTTSRLIGRTIDSNQYAVWVLIVQVGIGELRYDWEK